MPCGEWPKDQKQAEIGTFIKAAITNDIEGSVGYSATTLGWSQNEVTVYASHLRKELRDNGLHSYCRNNVVWAQKLITVEA